ncbi:MAG TPA: helix-turn-helix transcriptional regulator [Candidatus Scatovivens faecipullorum]|nr:helix-turn-helix transcriptional regulator [Candidatus Scatovivens faecipullorum]
MDKVKIGQFIANCRKDKKLTQEQLAEKLNISKNAVSKWERGICLMDMSLLKPLSEILGISVNDILSGEKIPEDKIKEKSEENVAFIANFIAFIISTI